MAIATTCSRCGSDNLCVSGPAGWLCRDCLFATVNEGEFLVASEQRTCCNCGEDTDNLYCEGCNPHINHCDSCDSAPRVLCQECAENEWFEQQACENCGDTDSTMYCTSCYQNDDSASCYNCGETGVRLYCRDCKNRCEWCEAEIAKFCPKHYRCSECGYVAENPVCRNCQERKLNASKAADQINSVVFDADGGFTIEL